MRYGILSQNVHSTKASKVFKIQNSNLVKVKIVTSGEFSNLGITFKTN